MRFALSLVLFLSTLSCTQNIDVPGEETMAPNFLRLQSWLAVSSDGLAAEGFLRWVYLADDPAEVEDAREYCEIWERLDLVRIDSFECAECTDVWDGVATVEVDRATCIDVSWDSRAIGLGFGAITDGPEDVVTLESQGFTHAVYLDWSPDQGDMDGYEGLFVARPERWSNDAAPIGTSGGRPVAGDYSMDCLYYWDIR